MEGGEEPFPSASTNKWFVVKKGSFPCTPNSTP